MTKHKAVDLNQLDYERADLLPLGVQSTEGRAKNGSALLSVGK